MYYIISTGTDCDGYQPSNRNIQVYFSKKVAQKICDLTNESSDGIIDVVIDKDTFYSHYATPDTRFSYFPTLGFHCITK